MADLTDLAVGFAPATPPPAAAAAAPAAPVPAAAASSTGSAAAAPPPDGAIAVVGPATLERWQTNPPGPPAPGLTGYAAQDAAADYADYTNWKAQQAASASQPPSQSPYTLVTPPGSASASGVPSVSPGPAQPSAQQSVAAAGAPPQVGASLPAPPASSPVEASSADPKLAAINAVLATPLAQGPSDAGAPASAAAVQANPTPGQPDGKVHGLLANLGAGTSRAVAGTLGAPVDLATGAMNLIPEGINAVTGANLPTIQNPVAGSQWWKSAMGLLNANPDNVAADNAADRIAQGIGEGVAGTILPMGIAGQAGNIVGAVGDAIPAARGLTQAIAAAPGPITRGVAQTMAAPSMLSGATAGAAAGGLGATAAETVADPYKPVANFLGNLAGGGAAAIGEAGLSALAGGAGSAARSMLAPVSSTNPLAQLAARTVGADIAPQTLTDSTGRTITASPGQIQLLANRLAQAAGTTPQALADAIPDQSASQWVPGSQPSLGQATGNTGVLNLERTLRTQNKQPFNDAEAANNSARLAAMEAIGGPAAHADAAANYVLRQLRAIDAGTDAEIAKAQTEANAWLAQNGAHGQAADYGQAIRESVEQRRAPAVARLTKEEDEARRRLSDASTAMGGEASGSTGATAAQRYGAALRASISRVLAASKAEVSRLFDAIDPDGTLTLPSAGMRAAGRAVRDELIPGSGATFTPRVEHWVKALEDMPSVVTFRSLRQTRQGIGEAMRAPGVEPTEMRQLGMLRDGVDTAIADAVAGRAKVEAPHVEAGHLGPEEAALGRLAREAMERYSARDARAPAEIRDAAKIGARRSDVADPDGDGAGYAPGLSPRYGSQSDSRGGQSDRLGGALVQSDASQPTRSVSAADAAAAYERARAGKVAQVERFQGAPSAVTARGKNGAEFAVPDSQVAARFWNSGSKAAEDAQSLVRALGSREEALRQIADYAALDLRTAHGVVRPDGTFNADAIQKWIGAHRAALDVFPELRQRFGTALRAQQELNEVQARRTALDKDHPISGNATNADVAARYWRPGRNGAEAVQAFERDVGTGPREMALLSDTATASLQSAAMKGGTFDEGAYDRWMADHAAAMSAAPPELRQRFQEFGAAQRTVSQAIADKADELRRYQDSAARFYLDRNGGSADPQVAIGKLMSSSNPAADAAQLMRIVGKDTAARDGVRRNLADWIFAKARSTAEAGTTNEKQIAKAALDRVMNDPKTGRALDAVFTPEQVETLRAVLADMDREARSVNATKIPGSPGTAADTHAVAKHGGHGGNASMLWQMMAMEMGGEALTTLSGEHGLTGLAVKAAGIAVPVLLNAMRQAGMRHVDDLLTQAVLHPEIGRVLLSRPSPAARASMWTKLAGLIGDLAVAGGTRR